jgi:hypothetical protein
MSLVLKSNESLVDAGNLIPYLERDVAILRGVTKGMIDFSNAYTLPSGYVSGASIASGTAFKTLTSGGSDATTTGTFEPGVTNGGLNGSVVNTNVYVTLPDANFKPPVDGSLTRGVFIAWMKLKPSGYPVSQLAMLFGDKDQSPNSFVMRFQFGTTAGGLPNAANTAFQMFGITIGTGISFFDNTLHQLAITFEKVGATLTLKFYVDGVFVAQGSGTETLATGGANRIILFSSGAFSAAANIHGGNKFYRYAFLNASARPDLSLTALIAADDAATRPYIAN